MYDTTWPAEKLRRVIDNEAKEIYTQVNLYTSLEYISGYYAAYIQLDKAPRIVRSGSVNYDDEATAVKEKDAFLSGGLVIMDTMLPTLNRSDCRAACARGLFIPYPEYCADTSLEYYATIEGVGMLVDWVSRQELTDEKVEMLLIGEAMYRDQPPQARPDIELAFTHGAMMTANAITAAIEDNE